MEQENKKELKAFTVMLDTNVRQDLRFVAVKNHMLVKELVDRVFNLVIEAGSVEALEEAYRNSQKK